jgi:hypothetical protein
MSNKSIEEIMDMTNKMSNEQMLAFMVNYFDWEFIFDHLENHLEYLENEENYEEMENIVGLIEHYSQDGLGKEYETQCNS